MERVSFSVCVSHALTLVMMTELVAAAAVSEVSIQSTSEFSSSAAARESLLEPSSFDKNDAVVAWWARHWQVSWVNVTIQNRTYPVRTRRVGHGPIQLFCVQGGPGGLYWDLDFLAVYLDLSRYQIIQYDPLGSLPSACSLPKDECFSDRSWMSVEGFVETMDQVHRAMNVSSSAVIVAHSFGVVCTLEFLLRWPWRAGGAVLSDWVPSQAQATERGHWCNRNNWELCRMYKPSLEEPWRKVGMTNHQLGQVIWGPHGDGVGGDIGTWDVRSKLPALQHIPTLAIAGGQDIVFPADVQAMSEALLGDYLYCPDAGHFSFVDCRSEWLLAFDRWIKTASEKAAVRDDDFLAGLSQRTTTYTTVVLVVSLLSGVLFGMRLLIFAMRPRQLDVPLLVSDSL